MHRLCSLKELVPGSAIELPKEYQARRGETAIVFGASCQDNDTIALSLVKPTELGEFIPIDFPALPRENELPVVEDVPLRSNAAKSFIEHRLLMPSLPLTMGCDPEIFVLRKDETIFPAWAFMPDEKSAREEPSKVDIDTHTHTVPTYWDGFQAEFAPKYSICLEIALAHTKVGLLNVLKLARAKDPDAKLTIQNVVEIPKEILTSAADKHVQFRCSRSINIYNDEGGEIPDARGYKWRSAGGHIHIGYKTKFTSPTIESIVKGLDGILGVVGVSLAAGIDNPERRNTYGRAGEFRLPDHGLEYRVLSNFWLCHPAIAMLVFELARVSVRMASSGLFNLAWNASETETRNAINNCDVALARKILKRNDGVLKGILTSLWTNKEALGHATLCKRMRDLAFETILKGVEHVVDPCEIEKNWNFDKPFTPLLRGKNESWKSLTENL